MNTTFKAAMAELLGAKAKMASAEVQPLPGSLLRVDALEKAIVSMALEQGCRLQEPLELDVNGDYSIIALHESGRLPTDGCGEFGKDFAAALTRHNAQTCTAIRTHYISPFNGYCWLNQHEAEKMVCGHLAGLEERLHILQHSLGVNKYGEGVQHRNHFVTGPGGTDHPACLELVQLGFMRVQSMNKALTGGSDCFVVTPQGIDYVAFNSPVKPPEPKLTRSQQNYQDYRRSECVESFSEWMGFPRKLSPYELQLRVHGFAR